ncbi:MAG TPA: DUF4271 domain-containing protein [Bacteroidales bacterium]|nr:DUF4271 domain-containing protein [Bacteroidales bacterium]
MDEQSTDSTFSAAAGSVMDTIPQAEFLFGKIIPIEEKPTVNLIKTTSATGQRELYEFKKRDPGQPVPDSLLNTDFSFGILTLSFVLITVLSAFARKSLRESFLSILLKRQHELSSLSSSVIISWPPLVMNLFTLFSISLFAAIAAVYTGIVAPMPGVEMIKTTAICFVILAGVLLFRHITCIIVASVSGQKKLFMEYVSVVYNTWFIAALCSFALSSVILFLPVRTPVIIIYAGAALFVFLLLLRTIRLLNIFIIRRVPLLYFILYLCALEILPVLIVLKILSVF